MLTDIEEQGIKIAVLLRKKMLNGIQCSDCSDAQRESRNHNGDADHSVPVFYNIHVGEFYVCPIVMIPKSVYSFLDRYDYYEKYPSAAPSYEEVNPRFWDAVKVYENFMGKIEAEELKSPTPKVDNLAKLRNLIPKKE